MTWISSQYKKKKDPLSNLWVEPGNGKVSGLFTLNLDCQVAHPPTLCTTLIKLFRFKAVG